MCVQWGKAFREYKSNEASVTVTFDDGSSCAGSVLVACDGVSSRVRRQLFPFQDKTSNYQLPIALLGLRVDYTPEQCRAMREFDAYFLHATASASNIFTYFSGELGRAWNEDRCSGLKLKLIAQCWTHLEIETTAETSTATR